MFAVRCILGFNSGPPMTPGGYNQNVQVFQTKDHVVLLNEMVHSSRVIPLDGRARLPDDLRQWMGDSRGRWEGDALVVETTNFLRETSFRRGVTTAALHLVERFTRVSEGTLMYEVTVEDPNAWDRPWTYRIPMVKNDQPNLRVRLPRGELRPLQHHGRRPREGSGGGGSLGVCGSRRGRCRDAAAGGRR